MPNPNTLPRPNHVAPTLAEVNADVVAWRREQQMREYHAINWKIERVKRRIKELGWKPTKDAQSRARSAERHLAKLCAERDALALVLFPRRFR